MNAAEENVGIARWGVYIPRARLPLNASAADGRPGPERAVAGFDEDSVTLGVAAARDCLDDFDRSRLDLVLFATTTAPFAEKQNAALLAAALNLPAAVRSVDITGSTRSGSEALLQACASVRSGSARAVLVVAADCRMAAPGSGRESQMGDAAVAFLVQSDAQVKLEEQHTSRDSLLDVWRSSADRFVHGWEDRFVNLHGYREPLLPLLQNAFLSGPIQHLALAAPDARAHREMATALNLPDSCLVPPLFGKVGHCGAAFGPLLLIAALERASKGDSVLLGDYGDGASVQRWQCVEALKHRRLAPALERRRTIADYRWYLKSRELWPVEYPPQSDAGIPATVHYRERAEDLGLAGQVCRCGTHQFPRGRICQRCGERDEFQPVNYADRAGRIVTFTHDAFFPSPEPPTSVAVVEVNEGPRIYMQVADTSPDQVDVDLPVRFVFRCIHRAGGKPNYFWKCVPVEAAA